MSAYRTWVRTDESGAIAQLVRSTDAPLGDGWLEVHGPMAASLAQPGRAKRSFLSGGVVHERVAISFVADKMSAKVNEAITVSVKGDVSGPVRVRIAKQLAVIDGSLAIVWDTATGVTVELAEDEASLVADPLHLRWE